MYMYNYQRNLDLLYETPEELPVDVSPPKRPILAILRSVAAENREVLTEDETKKVLKYYNFPVIKSKVANNVDEALVLAQEMGYPAVLKDSVSSNCQQKSCRWSHLKSNVSR